MIWKPTKWGFEVKSGPLKIYISQYNETAPDRWLMTCEDLNIDRFLLPIERGASVDEAMRAAENAAKNRVMAILQVLL